MNDEPLRASFWSDWDVKETAAGEGIARVVKIEATRRRAKSARRLSTR